MLPSLIKRTCASNLRPRALFLKLPLVSVIFPSSLPTRKVRRVQTLVLLLILLAAGAGSVAAQTFSAPVNYISGTGPVSITSGDFNGDGYPDLAMTNYDAYDVTVYINQGNNTFAPGFNYVLSANGLLVGNQPTAITVGDFNGDGKPDLVVANQHSRNICVLFNRGNGTFNDPVSYTVGQYPDSVAVGDFNNDGKLDLVVANSVDDTVGVLLNKGDGTFANAVNYTVGRLPVSVSVADFNNDGQPDIAVANGLANNVSVLINNGNGTFAPAVNYSAGQNPFAIAVGDFNGDGKPDLVVASITPLGSTDRAGSLRQRVAVSAAYFTSQEFQDTGFFVYLLYKTSFGQKPAYVQFMPDRSRVVGGANLDAGKAQFVAQWVQRADFLQQYPRAMTGDQFIDKLIQGVETASGVDLTSQRSALLGLYDGTDEGRAAILHAVVDNAPIKAAEYNPAFVLMQYFGYLRRDPDADGYQFWLKVMNGLDKSAFQGMTCAFITSREYQERFSSVVTHSNADCGR